jgi:hypothetical protein
MKHIMEREQWDKGDEQGQELSTQNSNFQVTSNAEYERQINDQQSKDIRSVYRQKEKTFASSLMTVVASEIQSYSSSSSDPP